MANAGPNTNGSQVRRAPHLTENASLPRYSCRLCMLVKLRKTQNTDSGG